MAEDDWYQQRSWSPAVREEFFRRLRRARVHGPKYAAVQAGVLLEEGVPTGALDILDDVIADNPRHHRNQLLHRLRGEALGALGRADDAMTAFRMALDFRKRDPRTDADVGLALAWFVVAQELYDYFPEAAAALRDHPPTVTTPLAAYRFHASAAILEAHFGRRAEAIKHAESALLAARQTTSGWPRHPGLGLVGTAPENINRRLEELAR